MPVLDNSHRRFYKATYAPIDLENSEDGPILRTTRAFEKLSFVRSLAMRDSEFPRIKSEIDQQIRDDQQKQALMNSLAVIQNLGSEISPAHTHRFAPQLATIQSETLLRLGKIIVDHRRSLVSEVEGTLESIRDHYVEFLTNSKNKSPENHSEKDMSKGLTRSNQQDDNAAEYEVRVSRQDFSSSDRGSRSQPGRQTIISAERVVVPKRNQIPNLNVTPELAVHLEKSITPSLSAAVQSVVRSNFLPSIEEATRWATEFEPERISYLDHIFHGFSPVPAVYSKNSPSFNAAFLLSKLKDWSKWTQGMVSGFEERMKIEPVGRLHLERIEMTPVGVERGELVHSVPLTPKETVNISHKEWSIRSEEFDKLVQDYFEGYSEEGVTDKTDVVQATESQSKHSSALSLSGSVSASYASVTLSSSVGYNSTSDDQQSIKDSRNHCVTITRKASARTKKDHKYSFKVSSVAGSEDSAVRMITNPSDTDPMRVDYYQLMRKWRVNLYRYGLRMTYDIVIPNPGSELIRKIDELEAIDKLIDEPFQFPLSASSIQRNNWASLAATYKAKVDPPPEQTKTLIAHREMPYRTEDEASKGAFESLDFEVDPQYEVSAARLVAEYFMWDNPWFDVLLDNQGPSTNGSISSDVNFLIGKSGKLSMVYGYEDVSKGAVIGTLTLSLKQSAFTQWQFQAWNSMRQAAEELYFQNREGLKERRAKLSSEIGNQDALTLRRMEKEEIMKGVLRWLFGPTFELVPWDVQSLFTPLDPSNPETSDVLNPNLLSTQGWQRVMEFGEFIKYIHQAIEWENVLYFNYPYFWDSAKNWNKKLFLNHPDATHREFLRSGSARVVLTIRPGFEASFTTLLETGAFGTLPSSHPYVTIAQEIQNYANTNFPGIPPANPEDDPEEYDDLVQTAEKGILIARWYEYTPTSALDLALNTPLDEAA